MSSEKQKLEYEVQTTLADCVQHLEKLLAGLGSGRLVLKNRTEALQLQPSQVVSFSVKARQKGSKESLQIGLDWKRQEAASVSSTEFLQIETPGSSS